MVEAIKWDQDKSEETEGAPQGSLLKDSLSQSEDTVFAWNIRGELRWEIS